MVEKEFAVSLPVYCVERFIHWNVENAFYWTAHFVKLLLSSWMLYCSISRIKQCGPMLLDRLLLITET